MVARRVSEGATVNRIPLADASGSRSSKKREAAACSRKREGWHPKLIVGIRSTKVACATFHQKAKHSVLGILTIRRVVL